MRGASPHENGRFRGFFSIREFVPFFELRVKPSAGVGPMAISGGTRNAKRFGRLGNRQARVVPELHEASGHLVDLLEFLQGLMNREQIHGRLRRCNLDLLKRMASKTATVLATLLFSCLIDQDAAHGLGGGSEEMSAAVPTLGLRGLTPSAQDQAQVGLVN